MHAIDRLLPALSGTACYDKPRYAKIRAMPTSDSKPADDLVAIGEAARIAGVSIDTLRRWEVNGRLNAIRLPGGHRRFRVCDLTAITAPTEQAS
jgi:excisionase family DNA binding protein